MRLDSSDKAIVNHYAPILLKPLKYGENGTFFWIPGSGRTTIIQHVYRSKVLLNRHLSGFARHLEVIEFIGDLADEKSALGIWKTAGFLNLADFEQKVNKLIRSGREVGCVLYGIDSYSEEEKIRILSQFSKLITSLRGRFYVQFHSVDKPWFEYQLGLHPEWICLANRLQLVPVVPNTLLTRFIVEKAKLYGFKLTSNKIEDVTRTFGGIIQLTKQYLRNSQETKVLETKVRIDWLSLPQSYRLEIDRKIKGISSFHTSAVRDLDEFGIWHLSVFKKYYSSLFTDPEEGIKHSLTHSELQFWNYLNKNPNTMMLKDDVINVLRGDKSDSISLWAVDQAISRFRSKLSALGIDPERLVTVKKKGYLWKP